MHPSSDTYCTTVKHKTASCGVFSVILEVSCKGVFSASIVSNKQLLLSECPLECRSERRRMNKPALCSL